MNSSASLAASSSGSSVQLRTHSARASSSRPSPACRPCSSSRCSSSGRRSSVHVAAVWTPDRRFTEQQPTQRLAGLDRLRGGRTQDVRDQSQQLERWQRSRPLVTPVTANQPILAPRTAEMQGDPFSLLLRQRIVFMGGEVEDFAADALISQLLLLDSQDPRQDIKMFINSPGGSVTAGMGIYDAMMLCRADVQTYCFGLAASMGAFLLSVGKRGKRYSMPNSRIMIHQPLGGASGQAVDIEIQAKEIMYHKANLNRILADATLQPLNRIEEDTDRDRYMSPLEAKDYGLIDHVVGGEDGTFSLPGSEGKLIKLRDQARGKTSA